MLRLAGIIAACLLVLVAFVIAFNLGRGKTAARHRTRRLEPRRAARSSSPRPADRRRRSPASRARDFDPQGSDGGERRRGAAAVDGNPATAWTTSRYDQQFGPAGLKTGVGLVLDLGAGHDVSEVDLTTVGSPTGVQVYVTAHGPANLQGSKSPASRRSPDPRHRLLDQPATGRYVVVWLTRLPAGPGRVPRRDRRSGGQG